MKQKILLRQSTLWVHLLMLLTIALIATSFPIGKIIAKALPAEVMMLLRFVFAAVLFAPYVFYRNGLHIPARTFLARYALLSVPLTIFFWCMFESLRYTSATNTAALYTTVPAITAVFAWLINRETTNKSKRFGLALGTLGAIWIIFRGDLAALMALQLNYGDLLFFVGSLAMGLYSPLIKRLYRSEAMEVMTFWVIFFSGLWMFLLSLGKLPSIAWQAVGVDVFFSLLYLAFFTTVVSFFLLQFATVKIGSTRVAAYSFLNPIFVLLMTTYLGLDTFSFALLPGIVLIVSAMLLVQRGAGS
ncbi:MAG: DMT family transporter [Spirochaetota bacterium]